MKRELCVSIFDLGFTHHFCLYVTGSNSSMNQCYRREVVSRKVMVIE